MTPPDALMQPVAVPMQDVQTNGDLLGLLLDRTAALDACNADKAALRAWAEGARND